jgi:hypothetical protein
MAEVVRATRMRIQAKEIIRTGVGVTDFLDLAARAQCYY